MLRQGLIGLALGGAVIAAAATAPAAPIAVSSVPKATSAQGQAIEQVYWYRGHFYPYRWHGPAFPGWRYGFHRRWYGHRWHYW